MSDKETPEVGDETQSKAPEVQRTGKRYVMFGDGRIQRVNYDDGGSAEDIAVLNEQTRVLAYESEDTKRYHSPVAAFLNENAIKFDQVIVKGDTTISAVRAGETVDIPAPPAKNKRDGDKTKEYVDWFKKYYPEEYEKKYGIIGQGTVMKTRKIPHPEIAGRSTTEQFEVPAILSSRKMHLTEKPTEVADEGYAEIPEEEEKI
jgi:hypothetical protein